MQNMIHKLNDFVSRYNIMSYIVKWNLTNMERNLSSMNLLVNCPYPNKHTDKVTFNTKFKVVRNTYESSIAWIFYLLLFFYFFMSQLNGVVAVVPQDEIYALNAFYNSTNGEDWLWKSTSDYGPQWDFTATDVNPCNTNGKAWQGIGCSSSVDLCGGTQICHITTITLHEYNILGTIPNAIQSLTNLLTFDVYDNYINGTIPEVFGSLINLQKLDTSLNYIVGTIPSSLCDLTLLTYLSMYSNSLNGTIPNEMGNLISLKYLYLYINTLNGTIPTELGNLKSLQYLDIGSNEFNGTIPSELGKLSNLQILYLYTNKLSGTIPPELGNLKSLKFIKLLINSLTGTIPSTLSNLMSLKYIDFYTNQLTGSIPPEFGKMKSLQYLLLHYNKISGTIPSVLGDTINFHALYLEQNKLTGTIPPEIGNMTLLSKLFLNNNKLNGTIPSQLCNILTLEYFYLGSNSITGTIPSEIGKLTLLQYLYLTAIDLTGTIPSTMGNLVSLKSFYCRSSILSGTIPYQFGNMELLLYLDLDYNILSGSIPSDFGNMQSILYLDLHGNILTGTIPPEIGNMTVLPYLDFSTNLLSGNIPTTMGLLTSLTYLILHDNYLNGSIPGEINKLAALEYCNFGYNHLVGSISGNIGHLTNLQQLFLQCNHLTGSVSGWFDEGKYNNMSIVNIDLSDNRFSGSIPAELFLLPKVETVALTKNCFTGTLPSSMCQAETVSVFSMDGLGTAKECRRTSTFFFTNVLLGETMGGNIPECILMLRNLTVLSLSANGLTGTLGELREPSSLVNLSLSHNYISGTIPASVASHDFHSLDLSYNKMHGYVDINVSSAVYYGRNSSLILAVNRFSGGLPDFSVLTFHTLDVLSGNIFGCANSVTNDENSETYLCGSQELNQSLISLLVLLSMFLVIALYTKYGNYPGFLYFLSAVSDMIRILFQYYCTASNLETTKNANMTSLIKCLNHLRNSVWVICLCSIFFTAPIYILKGLDYDKANPVYATHSVVYMWEMTTAYITGELPAGLLLLAWFGCVFMFVILMTSIIRANTNSLDISDTKGVANKMSYLKFGLMFVLNLCVVGVMNGFYVYLTLLEFDVWIHTTIQVCFAFTKYIWNFIAVPGIVFSPLPISPYRSWLKLFVNMLNSVFIPCIASSFTSTSCFQGILINADEINSSYQYLRCDATSTNIDTSIITCSHSSYESVDVAPVVPPFLYNNLCGSVILTSYIPVYIYMYIMSIVINIGSTYVFCKCVNYSKLFSVIQHQLMGVMWPNHDWTSMVDLSSAMLSRKLLKVDNVICDILHHFCILLTFGLCCPVLAVTISTYVSIYVLVLVVLLGRFVTISDANNTSSKSDVCAALDLACSGTDMYISNCMWEVVCMSSVFYALLCWDMASDRTYWIDAVWIPVTAVLIPLAMWICYNTFQRYDAASKDKMMQWNKRLSIIGDANRHPPEHEFDRAISDDVELRISSYGNVDKKGDRKSYLTTSNNVDRCEENSAIVSPFSSLAP